MSFRTRSLSVAVLALGIAGAAYAQDTTKPATTPDTAKIQTERKHGDRPFFKGDRGMRDFGRGGFGGFGRHGDKFGGFGRGITLTDAQKAQIKQIREANKPDKAVFEEMRTIAEARRNGTITDAQKARIKELREQAETKAKSVHDQIENVLTADQKAQIEKNMTERKQRREEMKQRFEKFRQDHPRKTVDKTTPPTKKIV